MIYLAHDQRARSGMGEIVSLKVRPLCGCGLTRLDLAGPEHGKCPGVWFCRECRTVRPRAQFALYPSGTPYNRCRRCRQERQNVKRRRRYRKDKAYRLRANARNTARRLANPEQARKQRRSYYQSHRDQILATLNERYRTDPKYRAYQIAKARRYFLKRKRNES